MSKAEYLSYLKERLQTLEKRLNRDQARLATGTPEEKVAAAGDLAVVERRLAETRDKMSLLEAEPESKWENFKSDLDKDMDFIEMALDRWFERRK